MLYPTSMKCLTAKIIIFFFAISVTYARVDIDRSKHLIAQIHTSLSSVLNHNSIEVNIAYKREGSVGAFSKWIKKKKIGQITFSEKLFDLNGSCIYGCELKDYFIFSTSTEPSDKSSNIISKLLDNKPGPGILENKSDIVSYCKTSKKCTVLTSKKKDIFPYRLFQFGTIMFPSGKNPQNLLVAYNVGSRENDLSTEIYQL